MLFALIRAYEPKTANCIMEKLYFKKSYEIIGELIEYAIFD